MKLFYKILFCCFLFSVVPTQEAEASRLWDFFYKRYFKRNKLKKWAPRLIPGETPLENLSISGGYEVIGYEPSWMLSKQNFGERVYYYNLMTTLVTGEYDINPLNGLPRDPSAIDVTYDVQARGDITKEFNNIYQSADILNPKIQFLLQLTFNNDLGSPTKKYRHESNVFGSNSAELHNTVFDVLGKHYDRLRTVEKIDVNRTGVLVNIDFLDPGLDKTYFKDFLVGLREKHPDHIIYLNLPPFLGDGSIYPSEFIKELLEEEIVDKFVLKAYGFETISKKSTPSVRFDKTTDYSVEGTLRKYTDFKGSLYAEDTEDDEEGEEDEAIDEDSVDAEAFDEVYAEEQDHINFLIEEFYSKLVVEFPYFGTVWERPNQYEEWRLSKSNPYISIESFHSNRILGKSAAAKVSPDTFSLFHIDGNKLYYGDDSLTMGRKIEYLLDSLNIKGIGLNAVGYSMKEIVRKYRFQGSAGGPKSKALIWKAFANNGSIMTKKEQKFGWIIAYCIVAFLPIGMMYSVLNYWEVRNALAKHRKYYTRFKLFFFLFVFIFLVVADILPRDTIGLILGLIIIGCLLLYILLKKVIIRSKKYVNALK